MRERNDRRLSRMDDLSQKEIVDGDVSESRDVLSLIADLLWITLFSVAAGVAAFFMMVVAVVLSLPPAAIRFLIDVIEAIREARKSLVITYSPGWTLTRWIDFLFSKKSVDQIFQPIIADMQLEYFDALSEDRMWKARWVAARGYGTFWYALVLHTLGSLARLAIPTLKFFK